MSGDHMREEMNEQPLVLRHIAERAAELREMVCAVVPDPLDGIVFVGRGSSDNAAVLGRYAAELASLRPAGLAAPSLYTRYASAVDYRGYLAIGLSQSGATPEVVATCRHMRAQGARVVVITNEDASELADVSDAVLPVGAGEEVAIPATKTVTGEMALTLVVAGALGDRLSGTHALGELPDAVERVLTDTVQVAELAERWVNHERLVVTGRGLTYAAALETALKIKETAHVFAEGISVADLLHGPIAAVNGAVPVLAIDGGMPTSDDSRDVLEILAGRGVPIASCSPGIGSTLPMPSGLPEVLYTILATVRGQQLAYHMALGKGLDPDRPSGLTKITPTS